MSDDRTLDASPSDWLRGHDAETRLILDTHDPRAFAPVSHHTVGSFRDWLLSKEADRVALAAIAPAIERIGP